LLDHVQATACARPCRTHRRARRRRAANSTNSCPVPQRRMRDRCAQKKLPEKHTSQGGKGRCYLSGSDWTQLRLRAGGCQAGSRMGGAQSPSIGECIVADDGRPCQRQPLRGRRLPIRGGDPSTWFVLLLMRESGSLRYEQFSSRPSKFILAEIAGRVAVFFAHLHGGLPLMRPSWAGRIRHDKWPVKANLSCAIHPLQAVCNPL
jgi:hypothetical protein